MKLSFLGQSYIAAVPTLKATASAETFTFLGVPYGGKQFNVAERIQSTEALIYRGHRYYR
jgi:hypothetical protein